MTQRTLRLAPHLTLPLDAVSRTFGILAVRGAGKSNTAAVMAEEMFAAGLPFVVIDPVGSWYGLRSSADGTAPGLPIPIFGGKHGDVPLERGAGELLADLVVEKRLTCVLDLSRFNSEADKKAFLLAFARRLYERNENPLHLFLEEADDYIPQSPMGDEKQLLRAWENIVRRGRARGLGMTLITQRSAAVAKMVLTQVETLFAMRTTGPQDIAAIEAWVKYHQVGKEVLSTLASLESGEAWVWSPHYLKSMARHQIRRRSTFDSGATPANVRAKDSRPPATLADIDLGALQERMAATIEKAKADDPRELRKQLASVRSELQKAQAVRCSSPQASAAAQPVERFVLKDGQLARAEQLVAKLDAVAEKFSTFEEDLRVTAKEIRDAIASTRQPAGMRADHPARSSAATRPAETRAPRVPDRPGVAGVSRAEQRVLDAVAWWQAAGIPGPTRHQVAFVAGYTVNGHFNNMVGGLRTKGLVDYPHGGGVSLTDAGAQAAQAPDVTLTLDGLIAAVSAVLKGDAMRRIFRAVVDAGADLTREELAAKTGYTVNGHFNNMVGSLRSLGVIDYPRQGGVRLGEMFEALS